MEPLSALHVLIFAAYGFIMAATGVVTAILSSFLTSRLAMLFWKELSKAAILRIRLITGLGGAVLAYALLGNFNLGAGFGLGPGAGGGPGAGQGKEAGQPVATQKPDSLAPSEAPSERPAGGTAAVLRITLLGPKTDPPYETKNRYFAIAGDAEPRALDVDDVLRRVEELKKAGSLKEVEFVVSTKSTSLQNVEVQRLRQALEKAGLRVYLPNVDNPSWPPSDPK